MMWRALVKIELRERETTLVAKRYAEDEEARGKEPSV
jgi:hypothetical protein